MTLPAPTYDLVLLLDTQAEDSTRAKILADARSSIEARGELLRHDDWGERPLAYPIERRKSAEYHLFQFHASDNELLGGLDRTLRITDGVVRFRLIKLRPGVPDPPDMRCSAARLRARRAEGEPAAGAPDGRGAPRRRHGEPAARPRRRGPADEAPATGQPRGTPSPPRPEPPVPLRAETPAAEARPPPQPSRRPRPPSRRTGRGRSGPSAAAADTPPAE